jgi:hypothetical protein
MRSGRSRKKIRNRLNHFAEPSVFKVSGGHRRICGATHQEDSMTRTRFAPASAGAPAGLALLAARGISDSGTAAQVALAGRPPYEYAQDTAPGQGMWFAVTPDGGKAAAPTSTTADPGSGGGHGC